MLFLSNSVDQSAKSKKHPKLIVIFNDVSLYEKVSLDQLDEHIKKISDHYNVKSLIDDAQLHGDPTRRKRVLEMRDGIT